MKGKMYKKRINISNIISYNIIIYIYKYKLIQFMIENEK